MLLKKLKSFFLLLVLGFLAFSCDVDKSDPTPTPIILTPANNEVSIELLGVDKIEKSRFVFMGTLDGNPINIPEDSSGMGILKIELGSVGKLEISVSAYSLNDPDKQTATGSGVQEISASKTSFEIQLKTTNPGDGFYLTFNDDGEEIRHFYYEDEIVAELPSPTKDGYIFNGWFTESGTKLEEKRHKMTANLTVYAYWKATNPDTKYTVTFETNGGSTVDSQTVIAGTAIDAPVQPTKTDYTFGGWYSNALCSDGALVSFPYNVTADVTFYAKWESSVNTVRVTGVALDKTSLSFTAVNMTQKLGEVITPANATNKSVTWTSSNPSVATVSNGTVTALAAGSTTITVTTADGDFTATCSVTVSSDPNQTVSALILKEASSSTKEIPAFTVTAKYSDRTTEEITSKVTWNSTDTAVATVAAGGTVTLVAAGKTEVTATYEKKESNKAAVTVSASGGDIDKLYFVTSKQWSEASPRYAAYFFGNGDKWVSMTEHSSGVYVCDKQTGYPSVIFCRMNPGATENVWDNKWNQTGDLTIPADKDTYKYGEGEWNKGSGEWLSDLTGTYAGGALTAEVSVDVQPIPDVPTVNIKPASGEISLTGSVTVEYKENNATVTDASVTISGAVSKTYSLSDFLPSSKSLSISVDTLGLKANDTITVSASATNSEGTTTATPVTLTVKDVPPPPPVIDTFTWDNVNCYFVLTDRFYNGDTKNDNSYYRKNSNIPDVATFHGGDIKGLTQKLDYLDDLGVNAVWITAPYEQAHGWCSGAKNNFPHYAFHGYYTQDWTYMDQNMGTIEEFRTFVNEAHKRGIRVIMDVVMNHTGYNTVEDMITYNFGNFKTTPSHGWVSSSSNWGENHTITNYDAQGNWGNWWGCWVRAFSDHPDWAPNAGYVMGGSGDLTGSLQGLPDVVTESTSSVAIPKFLKTKWTQEPDSAVVPAETGNTCGNKYGDYKLPTIKNVDWYGKSGDWREDNKGAPTDYQVIWLSGWVREFGVDGFRCDTAKHVDKYRWGQLKEACEDALKKWRADSSKVDNSGAKNWDENFWMTGEAWGWTKGSDDSYYSSGKFDSMIDFYFNGGNDWDGNYRTNYPQSSAWGSYIGINSFGDSDNNGNRNNCLTYISSHDTGLTRVGDQYEVGTGLVLLPGGVQIYYGDESYREKAYTGCGDGDMMTRGDMNWSDGKLTGSVSDKTSKAALVTHWGKVGTFRKYNPAVGAGTGSGTKRTYNGSAGESKVAIGISGESVDVSGLFADGVTVYNWYDGKSATVSGGKVTFAGGSMKQPILVSDRDPATYGVTF